MQTFQPGTFERSASEHTGPPGAQGEPATPAARAPCSVSARVHESEGPLLGAQWPPAPQAWTGASERLQRWARVCSEEPGPELLWLEAIQGDCPLRVKTRRPFRAAVGSPGRAPSTLVGQPWPDGAGSGRRVGLHRHHGLTLLYEPARLRWQPDTHVCRGCDRKMRHSSLTQEHQRII